ncbi:MAG: succinate dehydrogenase cytochrome b subunit [Saprospiraceae bacterium]
MSWFSNFLTSSIGRKLIMSLTGLFLISFLIVHLIGNLQLFYDDGGQAFNIYAAFMVSNPLIKFVSIGLYFFIVLHTVQGLILWSKNRSAKGSKYAVSNTKTTSFASRNMALLGTFVLAFLFIHMGDFWFKMKFGGSDALNMVTYPGQEAAVKNLYEKVAYSFSNPLIVAAYLIGLLALAFHLMHGFQSAFQSLGINHKKYTPLIQKIGLAFSIIIPLAYAIIPIFFFFNR